MILRKKLILLPLLVTALLLIRCEKPEKVIKVATLDAISENISYTGATIQGEIIDIGNTPADDHGLLLSTNPNPGFGNADTKSLGTRSTKGVFAADFTGLTPNTDYFFKAYGTIGQNTVYGVNKQFKTPDTGTPLLSSLDITMVGQDSAVISFDLVSDGGLDIETVGIILSYNEGVTIENRLDSIMFNPSLTAYDDVLRGLKCDTTFYITSFASNSKGLTYGTEISFNTLQCLGVPELTTTAITNITETTASSGGTISYNGGFAITEKGVCWSTSSEPEISGSHTSEGSGPGAFSSNLTSLSAGTTYYIRAYATNIMGTGYGDEIYFTTDAPPGPITGTFTDERDDTEYGWVEIGDQIWMSENLSYLPSVWPGSTRSTAVGYHYVYGYNGTSTSAAKATTNFQDYGVLYNWTAAMDGAPTSDLNPSDVKGICPTGWHLPSDSEFKEMEVFLGMDISDTDLSGVLRGTSEGGMLKESGLTHWDSPNTGATNEAGFQALPGGHLASTGNFGSIRTNGIFWTCTSPPALGNYVYYRRLDSENSQIYKAFTDKDKGFSIRCVKDKTPVVKVTHLNSTTTESTSIDSDVTDSGDGIVTSRGICWNTSGAPTTSDSNSSSGAGIGSFSTNMTGLTSNTSYFVRAFATNEHGTSYSEEVTIKTKNSTVIDIDGNIYFTVIIGAQEWMADNLKTTRFSDGTDILHVTTSSVWLSLSTPGYSWYANDEATYDGKNYGALYNWYAVVSGNLCPTDWHVPSDAEVKELEMALGMSQIEADNEGPRGTNEGEKLKADFGWQVNGENGTNESSFTALPAGMRDNVGSFKSVEWDAQFWTATETSSSLAQQRRINPISTQIYRYDNSKRTGLSVRCVKD